MSDSEQTGFTLPSELPILPLRGVVVYPMMWLPLTIGQERSIRLVDDALAEAPENRIIGLFASQDAEVEEPKPDQIYEVGTAAIVHRMLRTPDGTVRLIVQGIERIRVKRYIQDEPYLRAEIEVISDTEEETLEQEALARTTLELFRRLVALVPHMPEELETAAINASSALQLAYLVAASTRMEPAQAQEILETNPVSQKLIKINALLSKELEVLELGRKIQTQAADEMNKMQREYFLREQLKAIHKELGEGDEQEAEMQEFEARIAASGMPEEALKEAKRELDRMRKMPTQAAEYSVIKTYLDWMVSLPWQVGTEDNLDIAHARQVLEEDHYGLGDIKDRILEFLAVRKLRLERKAEAEANGEETTAAIDHIRREREGVILCFVGPPGTGKTSLGQSIARAMGRKFIRLALGGIHDEAEIRGFRRTYIGSMPGRVIQSVRRAESRNPVFMLDEVDKLGRDFRGDPSSALLEVLDPEQNSEFRDHYLDVPFDLSQVFFITTANWLDTIPQPLLDRMEIIQLSSYTEEEKVKIAQGYLVPRQIKENGLRLDEVTFDEGALRRMAREYTREAGVRALERQIGTVCRKVATKVAERQDGAAPVTITAEERDRVPGPAQVPAGGRRSGGSARRRDRPGLDARRRRCPVPGSDADARQQGLHAHRPARRRDEGIGAGGHELGAEPGERLRHRRGILRQVGHPPAHPGRRHAQGRPQRGRHHGHGAGQPADGPADPQRRGHDGRDHAARAGAAHRRRQGEGAGGQPFRADDRHPAQAQRGRSGGRARGRAVEDELHLR